MKCISCNKSLEYLFRSRDMVNGGFVEKVIAGYGSSFDRSKFRIAVCDECIDKKLVKKDR